MVESKSKKIIYFLAFVIPCLILYILFFITPFVDGIGISLTNWDGLTPKTPNILQKDAFESEILSKLKNQKDKDYVMTIYSYNSSNNSYERRSVSGSKRNKLERIIRKTGYQPEKNKFIGLENYKKIFTGKIGSDFYPSKKKIEKFTKTSNLPSYISKKEFEKEIIPNAIAKQSDLNLIKSAYIFDSKTERYKLNPAYDEFTVIDAVWLIPEVEETKSVSENELDSFIRLLKKDSATGEFVVLKADVDSFTKKNNISFESSMIIENVGRKLISIAEVKSVLSKNWIVINRNMGVIGFTIFFAVFSVIGINVLAFALALALDTGIRGQKVLRTVFFLPNVLSMVIVALIWSMIFVQLLPSITGVEEWLSDSKKTPWLIVLVAIWQGCGYYMIIYLAGLQNIPTDIIEAAKIDGASGWQRFKSITFPLMMPSITISLFMTIANALKSFDLIYAMIGRMGYATGTVPFVMDIYYDAFSLKQAGLATAKAMVLFVIIVIITGIQLFTMKRKEVEA